MMSIGCQIYLKRIERKWSQKELARRAGIPQPNLSNIEKGKQDITVSTLQKIAFALHLRMVDFFKEENREGRKFRLTRERVERLARIIVEGEGDGNRKEGELARLFRGIIPHGARRDVRVRKTQESWLKLRSELSSAEIKTVCERVRDYRMRIHEEKRN